MASYEVSNFRRLSVSAPSYSSLGSTGTQRDSSICHWFSTVRLSRVILCILIVLVIVPVVTHWYLSTSVVNDQSESSFHSRTKLDLPDELGTLKATELKIRIEEMLRIKISVNNELRDLESKRQKLQSEISSCGQKIEDLKNEASRKQMDLERIKLSISQAEVAHQEILERNQPELKLPAKLSNNINWETLNFPPDFSANHCTIFSCVDFSRCSLISGFPVFVYPLPTEGLDERISATLSQTFNYNPHVTTSPQEACIFVYVIQDASSIEKLQDILTKLTYWAGDGRNHIILNLAASTKGKPMVLSPATTSVLGRSMIVQSVFDSSYRSGFDLVAPPLLGPPGSDVWYDLPSITPARRRYLLSFTGKSSSNFTEFQSTLEQLQASKTSDEFYFEFQCADVAVASAEEMVLCGSVEDRAAVLKQSTFVLIVLSSSSNSLTTYGVQIRLFEALKYGAIPMVIGGHNAKFLFPYADVIDWNRAVIQLPMARLPELHFLTRSVNDRDILAFRRNGRVIWEKYFGSVQSIVDSIIAVYRQRIGIPPAPISDEPSPSVFNDTFVVSN